MIFESVESSLRFTIVFSSVILVLFAYIMGSINGAILVSKLFYRKDIRDYGSGNAGLTNTYRVFGTGSALAVFLIDVLKTVIPVLLGGWVYSYYFSTVQNAGYFTDITIENAVFFGKALAGFVVMLGHCFPLFYKFKGGKGVMAIGAVIIMLDWRVALIGWGVFILIVLITRYVSLGSVIGSSALPVAMIILDIGGIPGLIMVASCVLLLIVRHTPNLRRLFAGQESKINFSKKKSQPKGEEGKKE